MKLFHRLGRFDFLKRIDKWFLSLSSTCQIRRQSKQDNKSYDANRNKWLATNELKHFKGIVNCCKRVSRLADTWWRKSRRSRLRQTKSLSRVSVWNRHTAEQIITVSVCDKRMSCCQLIKGKEGQIWATGATVRRKLLRRLKIIENWVRSHNVDHQNDDTKTHRDEMPRDCKCQSKPHTRQTKTKWMQRERERENMVWESSAFGQNKSDRSVGMAKVTQSRKTNISFH